MKNLLSFAAMLAMVFLAWSADGATTTAKKKPPVKKGTSAAKKKAVPGKVATGKKAARTTPPKRVATTWRNRQTTPSTDRYREIQQALASKGYLKPENATGTWNGESADALKKFQSEQNIDASGKINSLSLIALGLGPKRESMPPKVPSPPADGPGR